MIYKYPVEFNSIIPSLNYISLSSFVFYVANDSPFTYIAKNNKIIIINVFISIYSIFNNLHLLYLLSFLIISIYHELFFIFMFKILIFTIIFMNQHIINLIMLLLLMHLTYLNHHHHHYLNHMIIFYYVLQHLNFFK